MPFVFYPAADWPHKNHPTLLRAMAILVQSGRPEHLVLTGILAQSGDKLRALADELGIADRVHFLGCVDQRTLIGLYRRAALLAFPSRFEGFGLPLVEAMQLGCPVVASRAGAVVETAGNAAVFCDDSPEAWAEALAAVLVLPALQADLRRRGHARAAEFAWDRCARCYLDLFRRLASRRPWVAR
jgi:glycosyltransferase involved in cell wall biosynthesis